MRYRLVDDKRRHVRDINATECIPYGRGQQSFVSNGYIKILSLTKANSVQFIGDVQRIDRAKNYKNSNPASDHRQHHVGKSVGNS